VFLFIQIFRQLQGATSVAITTDAASVLGSESVVALTAHWIDAVSWALRSGVVALDVVDESHTAERIFSVINHATERFNLGDRFDAATTDNGSDFVAAIKLLKDDGKIEEDVRCATHTLQLVFTDTRV
jgi:hypothetical protein